jgi:hypothetical protein
VKRRGGAEERRCRGEEVKRRDSGDHPHLIATRIRPCRDRFFLTV